MASPQPLHNTITPSDGSVESSREGEKPPVTVVVLNWCREEVSRECLRSVESSDYEPLTVLLVDNGSEDASGDRLRDAFPHMSYLQTGSNLGYAGGNNRGIAWALERGAEWILILNNDTVLEPGTVRHLLDAAGSGNGSMWGGWFRRFYTTTIRSGSGMPAGHFPRSGVWASTGVTVPRTIRTRRRSGKSPS
ncbi:glycosyltransferase family 2 protein [Gemmatimonadota bacterium]